MQGIRYNGRAVKADVIVAGERTCTALRGTGRIRSGEREPALAGREIDRKSPGGIATQGSAQRALADGGDRAARGEFA
jgi:hypothetical protein